MSNAANKKIIAVIFGLVVFLLVVQVYFRILPTSAATHTVCASGCTFTTISAAISAATSGDTITVKNGTYSGFTVTKKVNIVGENMDLNNPINNGATINGQVIAMGDFAYDQGPTVRGFRIIGGSDPVVIENSAMTVEYNYIKGTGGDNVSFEGGGGIVRGNRIEADGDDGIDVDSQSKNAIIEGNYILNSNQDGIEIRQQNVSLSSRISLWIRNNRIEGSGEDGVQIMDYQNFTNRHYVIERNLILNSGTAGVGLNFNENTSQNYTPGPMPEPVYIVNNTFADNGAGVLGGANAVIINNIFSGSQTFDFKDVSGRSVIKHNLFETAPKLTGSNNLDNATAYTGNPLLSSAYIPNAGSAAINKGIATYQHTYPGVGGASVTDTVINLTAGQYQGSAPDLGWKEAGSTGATNHPTVVITQPQGGVCTYFKN
jgi:hypothetical protein